MQLRQKSNRYLVQKKFFDTKGGKHQKKDSEALYSVESLARIAMLLGGGGDCRKVSIARGGWRRAMQLR